jgi:serine/threonine protein kinase
LYDPSQPQTVIVLRGAGTPQYAPPEQIDYSYGHTDARSDLFSLGATLYCLLTGKLPPPLTERLIKQVPIPPIWAQVSKISPMSSHCRNTVLVLSTASYHRKIRNSKCSAS